MTQTTDASPEYQCCTFVGGPGDGQTMEVKKSTTALKILELAAKSAAWHSETERWLPRILYDPETGAYDLPRMPRPPISRYSIYRRVGDTCVFAFEGSEEYQT